MLPGRDYPKISDCTTKQMSAPIPNKLARSEFSYKEALIGPIGGHSDPPSSTSQPSAMMELEGRPALMEIELPMKSEIARNLASLEVACIVILDRRVTHRALSLMFQRFLLTEETIKVAYLIWEHKAYLVMFPSAEMARTVVDSGPESFKGFQFYSKLWTPEWDAVSMDAHLAVWVEVGKFPIHFQDTITTRYILDCIGFILKFSQNFVRHDNVETFAVLMAVPSTRIIPEILHIKNGILNYNVTLKPVSVSAVAANVHLEEQRWEFLTRGERYYRAEIFDRPWDMPIDPYLAGFPEGRDGVCDHCHLHRCYCSLGHHAPPLVVISESSPESGHLRDEQGNVVPIHQQANGIIHSPSSTNGTLHVTSPTDEFRSRVGDIQDDLIMELYGTLSASANRGNRRRASSLTTPGSSVASARYVRRRTGLSGSRVESSSLSRPPGFSTNLTAQSTPLFAPVTQHSPISVL